MTSPPTISGTFASCHKQNRACFVGFLTAGYPSIAESADLLLAMERGGVDIIELGVPFSDPLADGPTIQFASQTALNQGVDMNVCFDILATARSRGLKCPVVMMGYLNPFRSFGLDKWLAKCKETHVSGVILVDFPPEEASAWISAARLNDISYIPLIAPTSTDERIQKLCATADGFVYVVSALGVTGLRESVNVQLPEFVSRIRECTDLPLAVGFGISTSEHFQSVAAVADGVVIGSRFIKVIQESSSAADRVSRVEAYARDVSSVNMRGSSNSVVNSTKGKASTSSVVTTLKSSFGQFGGQFAPETLMYALNTLEQSFMTLRDDKSFWNEFKSFYPFIGRPSPLQLAHNLTKYSGGARIWLKREDLNHTGSHKINNALGQVLLARRLGKTRIIAETGAGQHGVATATVCAHFNLKCRVYMGKTDTERQSLNVFRMRLLGAEVVAVERGDGKGEGTLKDAINEAMRDWVTNAKDTHYLVGSAIGPHPFPTIVKEYQSIIGNEAKEQFRTVQKEKLNPDAIIACVGGGSNAIGIFAPFFDEVTQDGKPVRLIGVEAGGDGVETGRHSAPLTAGTPGVLHGCNTYLMQDADGQIMETHSISAGLDYPGVGPEHSFLKDSKRAEYVAVTDRQALIGLMKMSQLEGIIPALETSHAIYHAIKIAKQMPTTADIIIGLSGRGDKDVEQVQKILPGFNIEMSRDSAME